MAYRDKYSIIVSSTVEGVEIQAFRDVLKALSNALYDRACFEDQTGAEKKGYFGPDRVVRASDWPEKNVFLKIHATD